MKLSSPSLPSWQFGPTSTGYVPVEVALKCTGPLFGTLPSATPAVVRMFASVVPAGKTPTRKPDAPLAVPLIDTSSPAVSDRRQYTKSLQHPVFSEPSVPSTVGSTAVFVTSATPGRIVGAPAIDVPPPAPAPAARARPATSPSAQAASSRGPFICTNR